jgi:hypothetical protein
MQNIAASSELQEDLDHPIGTFPHMIPVMHCLTVSLA